MPEMKDIVEQLRMTFRGERNADLVREAADEIEQLREALQRIVTLCSDDDDRAGIADIAVTALARGVLR